jgi:transposase-like protein
MAPNLGRRRHAGRAPAGGKQYTIAEVEPGVIGIRESHCLHCGRRLLRNGGNPRQVIQDLGLGRKAYRVLRKRCPCCGEIKPDYTALWPRFGHYHENYKRRARQHYLQGLPPGRARKALVVDLGVAVGRSTLARWVDQPAGELREVLVGTPVPTSGVWHYDEIFLRVRGERAYTIVVHDAVTDFNLNARASPTMDRSAAKATLQEARRIRNHGPADPLKSLVMDGTTNLGHTLHTRGFENVTVGRCHTHFKWQASAAVKRYAGLPKESRKPLPPEYHPLRQQFYRVLDAGSEGAAFVALEALRATVSRLQSKALLVALRQVEISLSKILAHLRDPDLPATNNKVENFNQRLEYLPTFKRRMMTLPGAQRAADYGAFGHNFGRFAAHVSRLRKQRAEFKALLAGDPGDRTLRGMSTYFSWEFAKLDQSHRQYLAFWNKYLAISRP